MANSNNVFTTWVQEGAAITIVVQSKYRKNGKLDTSMASAVSLSMENGTSIQNSLTNLPSHKAWGLLGSMPKGETTIEINGSLCVWAFHILAKCPKMTILSLCCP